MIEMNIDSIRISLVNSQRVILLKEKGGRYLPIWIGPAEADTIGIKLQGARVPRPLTYDLLLSMINTLGVKWSRW
jgi:bifunctional DNase/RNase